MRWVEAKPGRAARWLMAIATLAWGTLGAPSAFAGDWPQFRGVNSTGIAVGDEKLPLEISPSKHVRWRTPLPPGHSSPVVAGDRVFVTAIENGRLWTLALDRETGKPLWRQEAPHSKLEDIHRIGSHAQSSPASDGRIVVAFFGSCGLFAYRADNGRPLWNVPMGPFKNDFGAASSPAIRDGRVLLAQDHDVGAFLAAYDLATGRQLWRQERPEAGRNYCSPVVWTNRGREEVVVAGTLAANGYDLETGAPRWRVDGLSRMVCNTPALGEDGHLTIAAWSAGGDPGELIRFPPFDEVVGEVDANKNGALEESELPEGAVKQRFPQCERDKDGSISRDEYERFRGLFEKSRNAVISISPGVAGDATERNVAWTWERNVPFCASPVVVGRRVFCVKDGGILTTLDARTGKLEKTNRVPGTDDYFASPVSGDGKVYLFNQAGRLTVTSTDAAWRVLHTADFREEVFATPALVDGRVYVRTIAALYCFE